MKVMGLLKLRQRSKSFNEAYPPSATVTISRSGCQRLTNKSNCQAHSVIFLCRLPCSPRSNARKGPEHTETAAPKPEMPREWAPTAPPTPISEGAGLHEVGVAGSNRVAVEALCRYLLASARLQGFIDTHNQRSVRDERLHK